MVKKIRTITNIVNSWRICIDTYEDDVPRGRIYHMSLKSPESFTGWMGMIKKINSISDYNDFPQEGMRLRSFDNQAVDKTKQESNELIQVTKESRHGKVGTFRVRILFRQNATWQGSVCWEENVMEEHFRSALELMTLMDGCLSNESRKEGEVHEKKAVSVF